MSSAPTGPAGTVGLVVVSHSRALAEAAVELAGQMLPDGAVHIEVAAGLDDGSLGTDAVAIAEAISRADGPAGVVVLMDLGSAVLSAELALELLDPEVAGRVTLSPAPIVEGLVVAAVAATGGSARAVVAGEARDALLAKVDQLSGDAAGTAADGSAAHGGAAHGGAADGGAAHGPVAAAGTGREPGAPDESGPVASAAFRVLNPHGLHARPAARLVREAGAFHATIELTNVTTGAGPVPATSLSRVAMLGALRGHELVVRAVGPDAAAAVARLVALARDGFGEDVAGPEHAGPATTEPATTGPLPGAPDAQSGVAGPLPGAPGVAIGPARRMAAAPVEVDARPAEAPDVEWDRLSTALAAVRAAIEAVRDAAEHDAGAGEAAIFDAHLALLSDQRVLDDVRSRIDAGENASFAWSEVMDALALEWERLPDSYLRERAADVRAVADQVLRAASGTGSVPDRPSGSGIVVAADLTPAEAAGLDRDTVTGIVLAHGSPTSHAAILARARGIPLVVAAGAAILDVPDGTTLAIDGTSGEVVVDPPADLAAEFRGRARALAERGARDAIHAHRPAVTVDGVTVTVGVNVGSLADAAVGQAAGADGSGLVRTEFLFLGRDIAPTVDEQRQVYAAIADGLSGLPITVRTLDVGGDKPLQYIPMPAEQNPFLGVRGIRLGLARRDLQLDQLRAICEVARNTQVRLMFPMVAAVDELLAARALLVEAAGDRGVPATLQVGIMVEVPAAALKISAFLPHLDFVSIGTNDLVQYTLAAERGNGGVAALADPLDPAVLALIDTVCRACGDRIEVGVCGEAGADAAAIPLLLALGVRELSVAPPAVARVKAIVRSLTVGDWHASARRALTLDSARAVREMVATASPTPGPRV